MKAAEVRTFGVVGAGQMGSGIAQVAALAGLEVVLEDVAQAFVDRGVLAIEKSLERAVEKGKLSKDDGERARGRIRTTTSLADFKDCDFVVEAVTEDAALKREAFRELDAMLGARAVLASNTSSISITELAASTKRPDRFIGMHFFNPVPVMKLVELVRGHETSEATYTFTRDLSLRLGKDPCVSNDFPGFVSNRVLMPMINEAIFALHEGVADAPSIDKVMKLGMNHPMGPLELADFIGLDTCLAIMQVLEEGFGDSKYRPCPLLRKMVRAGYLGRKSGRGFYNYSD
ncbi:MAG TPA: 3-hydroxybutyryl-CoA dehydrogenase [Candidatus Thermoplasmatota archaeon]|nr:3-hydroxybutyryl-CoA dehydrogenase [Candidatus Thermoplasmatota archaeon]